MNFARDEILLETVTSRFVYVVYCEAIVIV